MEIGWTGNYISKNPSNLFDLKCQILRRGAQSKDVCIEIRFQIDKLISKFNNFQMLIHLVLSLNLFLLATYINFTHIHLVNKYLLNTVLGIRKKASQREFLKQYIRNDFILGINCELSLGCIEAH